MRTLLYVTVAWVALGVLAGDRHVPEFVETLRFGGGNGGDAYVWTDTTTSLSVDAAGRIYVADTGAARVLQFSAEGVFLKEIVSKGQGPGEVESLQGFQMLADGSAVAFEYKGQGSTLHYFDADLAFVRRADFTEWKLNPIAYTAAPGGKVSAITYNRLDPKARQIVTCVALANGSAVHALLSETAMPLPDGARLNDKSYWPEFFAGLAPLHFDKTGLVAFGSDGRVFRALSDTYQVHVLNADLHDTGKTISRKVDKLPWTEIDLDDLASSISEEYLQAYPPQFKNFITPETVRKGLDMAGVPAGRNPLKALIAMEHGGLMVVLDEPGPPRTQFADLFAADGTFLGQVTNANTGFASSTGQPRMVFSGGFAYTLETDEEGEHSVVRYRLN